MPYIMDVGTEEEKFLNSVKGEIGEDF